jgi:hypothetical protein
VDWEFLRRRAVGHDAAKLLVGLADAPAIADDMGRVVLPAVPPGGMTPWRDQLAIAVIRWLARWEHEHARARSAAARARVSCWTAQRLALLDSLTRT